MLFSENLPTKTASFCIFEKTNLVVKTISFSFDDHDLFGLAYTIRHKVFVEEEGVDPALEHDDHEAESTHYLLYYNNLPVGTARWRRTVNGIKLERFAVLPGYRNKGLGDALVKKVLEDVVPFRETVYLHSQLRACSLYQRHGFVISGEIFIEAGMGHYNMVLKG